MFPARTNRTVFVCGAYIESDMLHSVLGLKNSLGRLVIKVQ